MASDQALRCVLTHWYELRLPNTSLSTANDKRLIDIKGLAMMARRQKLDALRGEILDAARSRRVAEPAHLPVGAGLFPKNVEIETFVRRGLDHQREDYRLAAHYAAAFYVKSSEEFAAILAEDAMVGHGLLRQAAREALQLAQKTPCPRCEVHWMVEGWVPVRSS